MELLMWVGETQNWVRCWLYTEVVAPWLSLISPWGVYNLSSLCVAAKVWEIYISHWYVLCWWRWWCCWRSQEKISSHSKDSQVRLLLSCELIYCGAWPLLRVALNVRKVLVLSFRSALRMFYFFQKRETQAKELKDKPKPTKADVSGDLIKVTSVKKVQTLYLFICYGIWFQ